MFCFYVTADAVAAILHSHISKRDVATLLYGYYKAIFLAKTRKKNEKHSANTVKQTSDNWCQH